MEIPYGKVAIYILTFVGYVYSGYGSSILTNLRDAVISAEYTFNGVFNNVINIAKKVQKFTDMFDSAVEEECIFKCPNGKKSIFTCIRDFV